MASGRESAYLVHGRLVRWDLFHNVSQAVAQAALSFLFANADIMSSDRQDYFMTDWWHGRTVQLVNRASGTALDSQGIWLPLTSLP
jgi:hypothetical protein